MTSALSDIRVLDFATTIAGPYCARLLADLGADVIKIESVDGDMMRTRPPLVDGASRMFGQLNAGKRSVVLDLKSEASKPAVRKLIETADVIVENYRPGVMARFGLDYDTVKSWNERLIFCSISGFGQTGPSSGLAAYAPVIHAASGYDLAHLSYQPGRDRPDFCGIYVADVLAGTFGFGAIGAALHQRGQTGKGQHIDLSMLESMMSLPLLELQAAQFEMPPQPSRPLFGPTATSDGYVQISIASERSFQSTARAAGRLDWLEDPRFKVYLDRRQNWGAFMDEIEDWTSRYTTKEILAILSENGVPAMDYRSIEDVMADPQVAHRGAMQEVHDVGGSFKVVNPPFRFGNSEAKVGSHAPALGEHTRSVLEEVGVSAEDIAALETRS